MARARRAFARGQQGNVVSPSEAATRVAVLDMVPTVNQAMRIEVQESGLLLWLPLQLRWWMKPPLSWILPYRKEKGIALDPLGRQVLEACNGEATVERIVEGFAESHQLRFHEARQSVLTFLRMLVERRAIALVVDASNATIANCDLEQPPIGELPSVECRP
jgi:hypothetical protein